MAAVSSGPRARSPQRHRRLLSGAFVLWTAACTSSSLRPSHAPSEFGCPLIEAAGAQDPAWPLSVAIERSLPPLTLPRPGFPEGRTQRFVTAQVSETLIRLDCRGAPMPGLAQAWSLEGSNRWAFTLRRDATFSDGTPVTAADVVRSFGEVSTPRPWVDDRDMLVGWAGIRAARVRGDSVLVLEFEQASPTVPRVLAHPALVAVRHTAGGAIGSGPFAVNASTGSRMHLHSPLGARVSLTVVDGDPRDALDAGIDVVITRDARTLAYAAGLPDYRRVPLPWSDAYFLVRPRPLVDLSGLDRAGMAGIVPMDARAAPRPDSPWWQGLGTCPVPAARRAAPRQGEPRLVYPGEDPAARAVAERLVAVTEGDLRAVALPDTAYRRALGSAGDWGYVVRVPATPEAPCLTLGQLVAAAPWLSLADTTEVVPMIETRWHAIVVAPRVEGRVQVDHAGTLVVGPVP